MDTHPRLVAVGLALLGAGCASTAPAGGSAFQFEWGGAIYEIVADRRSHEATNDLVQRNGATVALRARDRDQDGALDTLLVGALPLSEANAIYAAGIERACAARACRVQEPARTYTLTRLGERWVVWSIARGGSDWMNRFARYGADNEADIFADTDADGVLDATAPGAAQRAYHHLLDVGRREGRVERVGSRYRVLVASAPDA